MPRNGNKEEMSLMRISGEEATLLEILEEVGLAAVHPRQLPRRLKVRAGVSFPVHVDLEVILHSIVREMGLRKAKHLLRAEGDTCQALM